ncbi:MAG: sulfatase-like hydrolase/transferase [Anaerolineae bacterium]|nr:sulfatase-like hydrolase/transferase [Anaerolineae bacterium]
MPTPPNILLITSDQQHYNALGTLNPRIQTPAQDRLAAEGMRFDRAYCNNPVCSPSRATIITGLYPAWHHCWTIGVKLPEDVPTIGDILQRHGYATTLVGKAHFQPGATTPEQESLETADRLRDLDFWRHFHGPWYGFEHVEITKNHGDEPNVGAHYAIWMEEKGLKNWADYFMPWPPDPTVPRRGTGAWDLPEEHHYTTWTGERTIANMERHVNEGRPFFLWSSFHDPHFPYIVSEPWASMYRPEDMEPGRLVPGELDLMPPYFKITQDPRPDFSVYPGFRESGHLTHGFHSHAISDENLRRLMAVYYGKISFMDREIGRILEALDRLGIAEQTLVVFSSDHGHFLGQHGLIHKGPFHYEDMIRVPLIVRFPGRVPAGTTSNSLQGLIDLPSTFLAAAGIPIPGVMQGVNQWDVWCGKAERAQDYVIVENRHQPTAVHLRTYVEERYKITVYRDRDFGELFDLQEDPGEYRNRWDDPAYAGIKCELLRRFLNAELRREPTRYPRIAVA